jgi:ABC-type polysaccharide/polyol phosphate transport system ATPase subunit
MTTAIAFDKVSKRFTLHHDRRNSIQERIAGLFRPRAHGEVFWALRDVSFGVGQGESLGLVGQNGAGKSTVLKLMTRILEPTSGTVSIQGRVAALLELGSGFHPDLSGRENVFLNGSLMGFSKGQMQARLEEIVDFAELGEFIDLEVKHYSAGMYTRLAFAVATAVDPDILITDEILAVGDEAFQRKCMERIYRFRQMGKPIVFVSHALDIVRQFCDQAVWLDHGQARAIGPAGDVIDAYITEVNRCEAEARRTTDEMTDTETDPMQPWRHGTYEVEIYAVELLGPNRQPQDLFYTGETLTVRMWYDAHTYIEEPQFGLAILHAGGAHVAGPNNDAGGYPIDAVSGRGMVEYTIPELPLLPGIYRLTVAVHNATGLYAYDYHDQRYSFTVRARALQHSYGLVEIPARWSHSMEKPCRADSAPLLVERSIG